MFLNVMVNQVGPQEEAPERFRKRKFLTLTDSRNRRPLLLHGSWGKCQVLVRRQKAGVGGSLGQSHYWGFLWRDKAGQGEHFRIGSRVVPSFLELWHDWHRGTLPPAVYGPDRDVYLWTG